MAEEKTNGEEIYGGADGALERAEKSMKTRREFIKKAMEPAEKAKKDIVKATATDEVRLQGSEETKAPKSLRPYVEKINVVDRKALSALVEAAKKEGRQWKVSRCLKEGYRYTFMTMRNSAKLNEKEDGKATKEKKAEAPKKEPKMKDAAAGFELTDVPAEELPMPDDAPDVEPEHVLTAMDVIRSMFDISVTEDGRLSICAIPGAEEEPKEGEEPACIVSARPVTDDEQAALGILPGDDVEAVSDEASSAEKVNEGIKDKKAAEKAESIDEASSAEKRAYRNGGEDAEDLYYGRVIARIKDKTLRDKAAKSYSGKRGEKPKADAKALLRKASDEEEAKFAKKQQKMQDKGYHEEDDYDMDEIEAPVEPKLGRKCPKCGKVDLNDAGECPLCDLGDESVLDDENESLKLRESKSIPDGKFIKTLNSPISITELIDELDMHDIDAVSGDTGVTVSKEDYDEAIDILMQMEMQAYSHPDEDEDYDDVSLDERRKGSECKACRRGIGREINPNYDREREGCDGLYESSKLDEDAPVEGVDVRLDDLDHFKPVAGARETWDAIAKEGKIKELAGILSDFAKDGKMTATDLNDMLWFERDWVLGKLGINGVDADDAFDVDAEEI